VFSPLFFFFSFFGKRYRVFTPPFSQTSPFFPGVRNLLLPPRERKSREGFLTPEKRLERKTSPWPDFFSIALLPPREEEINIKFFWIFSLTESRCKDVTLLLFFPFFLRKEERVPFFFRGKEETLFPPSRRACFLLSDSPDSPPPQRKKERETSATLLRSPRENPSSPPLPRGNPPFFQEIFLSPFFTRTRRD